MNIRKNLLIATSALLLSFGSLAANAQFVVRIGPPPPPRVEVIPRARPGYVWVPGFHRWDGRRYAWVGGHYDRPPRRGAVWVPGEWRGERGGHVWHEGYWR
jgi:hypothetical protein